MHTNEIRRYKGFRVAIRCIEVSPDRFEASCATFPPVSGGWICQDYPRSSRDGAIDDAWHIATERIDANLVTRYHPGLSAGDGCFGPEATHSTQR